MDPCTLPSEMLSSSPTDETFDWITSAIPEEPESLKLEGSMFESNQFDFGGELGHMHLTGAMSDQTMQNLDDIFALDPALAAVPSDCQFDFNCAPPVPAYGLEPAQVDQGTYFPDQFNEFSNPFCMPSADQWNPSYTGSDSSTALQNNLDNGTLDGFMPLPMDNNAPFNFLDNTTFPAPSYPDPQNFSLLDPFPANATSFDKFNTYPVPGQKRAHDLLHSFERRLSKKERRASINNYLAAQAAKQQLSTYDPTLPPENVLSIAPGSNPQETKQQMDAMRLERSAHFLAHPSSSDDIFSNLDDDEEQPPEKEKRKYPRKNNTEMKERRGSFYIQDRRGKHPGRKVRVPQTADVIRRNEKRRDRYRGTLTPEQRRAYDATRPRLVKVNGEGVVLGEDGMPKGCVQEVRRGEGA